MTSTTRTALVTGASRGLGLAIAQALAADGWQLILTARTAADLQAAAEDLPAAVTPLVGDVTDPDHRSVLARTAATLGGLDLLVNNASTLGPSPLPRLEDLAPDELAAVLATNTIAPLAVFQAVATHLNDAATVINITSDAAHGAWEGWGGYGASKAALEQLSNVLGAEHPDLHVHAVDPGDLRTDMHQAAFPGEDISDRPLPPTVVPALLDLVAAHEPSGRHSLPDRLAELGTGDRRQAAA